MNRVVNLQQGQGYAIPPPRCIIGDGKDIQGEFAAGEARDA